MAEQLFKFLGTDGRGMFSGFRWPLPEDGAPGAWVRVDGPLDACRHGIHACRVGDLPYWLAAELFEIEVDGDRLEHPTKVIFPRARLARRVAAWPDPAARTLAQDCAWTVRDLAVRELELLEQADWAALRAASDLIAVATIAEAALARDDPERPAKASAFLRYAADAATYACTGDPADAAKFAAYVAAYAADRATPPRDARLAPGLTAFAVERERQARMLAAGLAPGRV